MLSFIICIHPPTQLPQTITPPKKTQVLDLLEAFLGPAPLSPEQLHQLQLQHQLRHAQAALAHAQAQSSRGGGGGKGKGHTTPLPPPPAATEAEWRVELAPLAELALEKLKNLLLVMSAAGAFEPGEETIGAELWRLTWAVVDDRFRFCPGLQEELFGRGERQQPQLQQPQQQVQQHEHEVLAAELTGPLPREEQEAGEEEEKEQRADLPAQAMASLSDGGGDPRSSASPGVAVVEGGGDVVRACVRSWLVWDAFSHVVVIIANHIPFTCISIPTDEQSFLFPPTAHDGAAAMAASSAYGGKSPLEPHHATIPEGQSAPAPTTASVAQIV